MTPRVVIVDDSLTVRMDLAEAFQAAGFETELCGTAAEARARFAAARPDVVVLDLRLPDGDGIELLAALRSAEGGDNPVVLVLSSETEVRDRIRGLRTGADEYVGKPYDSGYVVARARELLRARQAAPNLGRPTVLVIDDSPTFRAELTRALESQGYECLNASSGEEGLRLAADRLPNAIVVDGVLPGIDGATTIRRLRLDVALRSIPCLLLTASGVPGAELAALEAGADGFVRKDEDVEVILARLGVILRGRRDTPRQDAKSSLGPRKILAVDDSRTYLEELSALLRGEGYDVVLAPSGEQALELLSFQEVDCILLDLMMPGIGGQETCRRIKAAPGVRDIPLILLTAVEGRDAMLEGLAAGADDYISKSGEFDVLRARVRTQIRRRQSESENRRTREELIQREADGTEARSAKELAETRAQLVDELERKNEELEAFSYSVSHDLRAPLRAIDGFSLAILEDYGSRLDDVCRDHLQRVRSATRRMGELIDDLLRLARISAAELVRRDTDLSAIAREIAAELQAREPERDADVRIEAGMHASADGNLVRIALQNLLDNAWKFTGKLERATIEVGAEPAPAGTTYFVRDDGAGFDAKAAAHLFRPFKRMHAASEFSGTGIGLATARRIIDRHGGRIWVESDPGKGATFYFTLARRPLTAK
jgi:two-component system NtrC family sensor kinase